MADLWARKEAFIRYDCDRIVIEAPFDGDFRLELMSSTTSRRWSPEDRAWTVHISERDKAIDIVKHHFDVIEDDQLANVTKPASVEPRDPVSLDKPLEIREGDKVEVWIDGACVGNPGPRGYAVLFRHNGRVREMTGGYRLTTNNRMEMMAAIVALEALNDKCKVIVFSDSRYLVDAVRLGRAKRWQSKGWKRNKIEKAINPDLWERLLLSCDRHEVESRWVEGHASSAENQRCDQLAEAAAHKPHLPVDSGYDRERAGL